MMESMQSHSIKCQINGRNILIGFQNPIMMSHMKYQSNIKMWNTNTASECSMFRSSLCYVKFAENFKSHFNTAIARLSTNVKLNDSQCMNEIKMSHRYSTAIVCFQLFWVSFKMYTEHLMSVLLLLLCLRIPFNSSFGWLK